MSRPTDARQARPRPADRRARRGGVRRAPCPAGDDEAIDFDVAESTPRSRTPDAQAARAEREAPGAPGDRGRRDGRRGRRRRSRGGPAVACPTSSALPPLLAATEHFESLRERLGSPGDPRRTRPPRRLAGVPHGAKSYLAAALALGGAGERLVWIARDAEIGDRVAEELGAWLGDPEAVAVLEPRTPWRTSAASSSPTRRRPGSRPSPRGAAAGPGSSSRACRRCSSTRSPPTTCRPSRASLRLGAAAPPGRTPARAARPRLRRRSSKSPGAASSPAAAGSSTSSRRRCRCRSGSSSSATRSTRCARSTRPTSAPSARSTDACCCRRASSCCPPAGVAASASASGDAARLPERLAADLARFEGADDPLGATGGAGQRGRRDPCARRRRRGRGLGAHLAPATGFDHVDPGTLLVLDEPGDLAEAAEFLWRQADERRAELIEAGELPKAWPATYLRRATGRAGSSARGLSSSPGNPSRPRARRWPRGARQLGRPVRLARAALPLGRAAAPAPMPSTAGGRTGPGSCSPRTRRRDSPRSSPRPATRPRS